MQIRPHTAADYRALVELLYLLHRLVRPWEGPE
jgi:hypothetical protein